MKKTLSFIGLIIVAAIVAAVVTVAVDTLEVFSYRYSFVAVYAATAIGVAALLGAFRDERSASRYDSIRHKTGRNYGQAAVFIGTACVFIGSLNDCEDVCDDLQHYAQQAHVELLSGNETFDIL